jgi:hemoglobin-like flavoprotein
VPPEGVPGLIFGQEGIEQLFYGRLFELQPNLRRMFHKDLGRQGAKLTASCVSTRSIRFCIADHYDTVEQALLWSMGHAMDGEFDNEHKAAWRAVIRKVSAAMKEGAAG